MESSNINKTIVITGATSGIGLAAAKALAGTGAEILGVGRSTEHIQDALQSIQDTYPDASLTFFLADLSSMAQVRNLAVQLQNHLAIHHNDRLDVLVNNAGMVTNRFTPTEDGYETQFAVNHLAPFLLTQLLMPQLLNAQDPRVITTSSDSHYRGRIHWKDVMLRRGYNTLRAYEQSKLANVLFTTQLNQNYPSIRAYAVDPGLVNTDIGSKGTYGVVKWFWNLRKKKGVSPDVPARTIVHLATADPLEHAPHEIYWKDSKPLTPNPAGVDPNDAQRLWELSERLCAD